MKIIVLITTLLCLMPPLVISLTLPRNPLSIATKRSYKSVTLHAANANVDASSNSSVQENNNNEERANKINQLISTASKYHREKKLAQAVETYYEVQGLLAVHQDDDGNGDDTVLDVTFQRALCLSQMGCVNDAIDEFQSAINIRQQQSMNTKQQLLSQEAVEEEQVHNKKIPLQKPTREEIYLANVMLDGCGDKAFALQVYQRCGFDSHMVSLTGITLDSLGRYDEAKKCYEQALTLSGGDADYEVMVHLCINILKRSEEEKRQRQQLDRTQEEQDTTREEQNTIRVKDLLDKVHSSPLSHIASSWKYIHEKSKVWQMSYVHYYTYDMIQLAIENTYRRSNVDENGLILEFGVFHGKTIRMIADKFPNETIHGFDTFEGLPSDWFNTKKGSYSTHGLLPTVPANVILHKGLFSDTIPKFLHGHQQQTIKFMNIDCDMYSSTKDIFDAVHDRIRSGTKK